MRLTELALYLDRLVVAEIFEILLGEHFPTIDSWLSMTKRLDQATDLLLQFFDLVERVSLVELFLGVT